MSRFGQAWLLPRPYLWIALLAGCLALSLWMVRSSVPFLQNLEGQVLDAQVRLRGPVNPAAEPGIAILMIDDRSIAEIGSLPIDRRILAGVVDRLHEAGAAWIVFDMLFLEPARRDPGADQNLVAAIKRAGNVVLPFALPADGAAGAGDLPQYLLSQVIERYDALEQLKLMSFVPQRLLAPIQPLGEAAHALGHVSAKPGADGSLRYDFPGLYFAGELFPSLAVRVAALAGGVDWKRVDFHFGQFLQLGPQRLPVDLVSRQWVNYYGEAGSFPTYSLADLSAGRLDPALFKGRIVLIGGTALGSSDRNPSPFDPALPGVERVATVIDNLLAARWLERPAWAAPVELASMLLLPLLAVMLIARLLLIRALLLVLLAGAFFLAMTQGLFVAQRHFISILFPMLALVLAAVPGLAYRGLLDERSRRLAQRQLQAIQEVTILAMTSLAETRDTDTGNHIRRTQHYVKLLAKHLSGHERFRHFLNNQTSDLLYKSAPLHDIGKVGIPDRILLKPGRFEPHEFEIMKTHCKLGRDAIQHAEDQLGTNVEFLKYAKEIAYAHQEKWDGSGYPEGLAGEAIPISARLMAIADVYDALISRRVYKSGMPHEKAIGIIAEGRGTHFDPDVTDAFLAHADQFYAIAQQYADSDEDMRLKAETMKTVTG